MSAPTLQDSFPMLYPLHVPFDPAPLSQFFKCTALCYDIEITPKASPAWEAVWPCRAGMRIRPTILTCTGFTDGRHGYFERLKGLMHTASGVCMCVCVCANIFHKAKPSQNLHFFPLRHLQLYSYYLCLLFVRVVHAYCHDGSDVYNANFYFVEKIIRTPGKRQHRQVVRDSIIGWIENKESSEY